MGTPYERLSGSVIRSEQAAWSDWRPRGARSKRLPAFGGESPRGDWYLCGQSIAVSGGFRGGHLNGFEPACHMLAFAVTSSNTLSLSYKFMRGLGARLRITQRVWTLALRSKCFGGTCGTAVCGDYEEIVLVVPSMVATIGEPVCEVASRAGVDILIVDTFDPRPFGARGCQQGSLSQQSVK